MGLTLLEMFRGGIVFRGASNNEMMWEIMTVFGGISRRVLKLCRRKDLFRDEGGLTIFMYLF
jgi:hypothetical protein